MLFLNVVLLPSMVFCVQVTASIVDYPYFASIETEWQHLCSATIVDDFYVMTTNSCVGALDVKELRVRVGTDKMGFRGGVFDVIEVVASNRGDVAMVKMTSALNFNSRVMPVNPNNNRIEEGQSGVLVSWSNNKHRASLAPAEVTVLPSSNCSETYHGVMNITDTMFCLVANGTTSRPCLADVGAPLYYNEQYYGLVTHAPGCSSPDYPVVVTAVAPFTSFIISVLCDFTMFI